MTIKKSLISVAASAVLVAAITGSRTKDVVSGEVTLGSSTYSLRSDTNDSVKSRIKFFSIGKNLYFLLMLK